MGKRGSLTYMRPRLKLLKKCIYLASLQPFINVPIKTFNEKPVKNKSTASGLSSISIVSNKIDFNSSTIPVIGVTS